jgi:hypothetical protein
LLGGDIRVLCIVGFNETPQHWPIFVALRLFRGHQIGQRHDLITGAVITLNCCAA